MSRFICLISSIIVFVGSVRANELSLAILASDPAQKEVKSQFLTQVVDSVDVNGNVKGAYVLEIDYNIKACKFSIYNSSFQVDTFLKTPESIQAVYSCIYKDGQYFEGISGKKWAAVTEAEIKAPLQVFSDSVWLVKNQWYTNIKSVLDDDLKFATNNGDGELAVNTLEYLRELDPVKSSTGALSLDLGPHSEGFQITAKDGFIQSLRVMHGDSIVCSVHNSISGFSLSTDWNSAVTGQEFCSIHQVEKFPALFKKSFLPNQPVFGVGFRFSGSRVFVAGLIDNSPAAKANLHINDELITINSIDASTLTLAQLVDTLKSNDTLKIVFKDSTGTLHTNEISKVPLDALK